MYGLTTIKRLLNGGGRTRALALAAVAALAFLWATSAPALAQGRPFEPTFRGGVYVAAGDIGLARGQTLRVTVHNSAQSGAQRSRVTAMVVTFDRPVDPVLQTDEVEIPAGGSHSFDLKRDNINLPGEPVTGRLQLWIVVRSVLPNTTQVKVDENLVLPTFEVMNTYTGVTTGQGTLVKTGTGTLTLSATNSY